jgi:MFS superfamily sulfate permease-like transporter
LNLAALPGALYGAIVDHSGSARTALSLGVLTIVTIVAWTKLRPERLRAVPAPLVGVLSAVAVAVGIGADVSYVSLPQNLIGNLQWLDLRLLPHAADPSLLVSAASLAVIASAETLLCAAAVDRMQDRVRTNYDRELLAQGLGNTVCGLVGGLPMTGVIVRSSANIEACGRTRLSTMLHGVWILSLVVLFPDVLTLVPTASLAGVLVYTGYKLVSPEHLRELRGFGWGAIATYVVTLVGVVASDLLTGVVIGLLVSVVRLLRKLGSFSVDVEPSADGGRVDVFMRGAVTFVGLPRFSSLLERLPPVRETHIHIENLSYIDHACLVAIEDYERSARSRGGHVVIDRQDLEARSEKITESEPEVSLRASA